MTDRETLLRRRVQDDDEVGDGDDLIISHGRRPSTALWRRTLSRLLWPRRRCACCSMRGCFIFGATLLLLFFIVVLPVRRYFMVTNHATELGFLHHDECPACFGQSMCLVLQDGAIQLNGIYQYPVFEFLNLKNVIHGSWRRGGLRVEPIVLKQLGHTTHLRQVHMDMCMQAHQLRERCVARQALWRHLSTDGNEEVSLDHARHSRADISTCISERLLAKFKASFRERSTSPDSDLFLRHDQLILLYSLKVNPEPLLLQAFPYNRELWPHFPRYHGACGRWIVVDDRGQPLNDFASGARLSERLAVAHDLLRMAADFTTGQDDFTLYMGDASWDNIVVDSSLRPALIDLSNMLVVDRLEKKPRHPVLAVRQHQAPFDACPVENAGDCHLTWDIEHLCMSEWSDYNFYVVCRYFLSPAHANDWRQGGLLPDLVGHPAPGSEEAVDLLNRCANPGPKDNRQELAGRAQRLLGQLQERVAATDSG